jgi:hypothetical protein
MSVMAYIRKTKDYWDIEQNAGYGWEVVTCEESKKDVRQSLKDYRLNQPEFPVRSIKHREKIDES